MKDVRVFFRISQSEKEALDRISSFLALTPSSLFRLMLAEYNRKLNIEKTKYGYDLKGDANEVEFVDGTIGLDEEI